MAGRDRRSALPPPGALGWVIAAVVVGISTTAVLTIAAGDALAARVISFVVTVGLVVVLGGLCLVLVRRAERERRAIDAERQLVRVSVEESQMARQRAEQADNINRQLIQLLGRELRTPLAGIRGFARELQDRGDRLEPQQREEFFAVIRRQSSRLLRIIEDLNLAARLASGEDPPEGEPVDVAALVEDVAAESDLGPAHRIVVTTAPELPRVRADASELRQAMLALVENAGRFSPAGGVIEVVALPGKGGVEISVRDEGDGVPPGLRDQMFELLGGDQVKEAPTGLGIGLFLVRGVAARWQGEVRYSPTPGGGSTFVLSLPSIPGEEQVLTSRVGDDTLSPE